MVTGRTRHHRTAIVFGAFILLLGAALVVGSIGAYVKDTRIERSGARATAVVVNKQVLFAADGRSDYELSYVFEMPDGREMPATCLVSKQRWSALTKGDTFEVVYDPAEPGRSFPRGEGVTSTFMMVFACLMGAVLALFGWLLLGGGLRGRTD